MSGRWHAVADQMPQEAEDDGDILYCRVVYDAGRPTDRRVGYFDGGEWKDISGYKFSTYGGTVTHWYEPPALPDGVRAVAPLAWERRQGLRCRDGWSWSTWQPCTEAEAQRVTGLHSWQVRQTGKCQACAGTGRVPSGVSASDGGVKA